MNLFIAVMTFHSLWLIAVSVLCNLMSKKQPLWGAVVWGECVREGGGVIEIAYKVGFIKIGNI